VIKKKENANNAIISEAEERRIIFGKSIKNRLRRIGKTNNWLAEKSNTQPSTISRIISGEIKNISWDLLTSISSALTVSLETLLGESAEALVYTGIDPIDKIIEPINFNLFRGNEGYQSIYKFFSLDYRLHYSDDYARTPIDLQTELHLNSQTDPSRIYVTKANLVRDNIIQMIVRTHVKQLQTEGLDGLPVNTFSHREQVYRMLDEWVLDKNFDEIKNGKSFLITERWITSLGTEHRDNVNIGNL